MDPISLQNSCSLSRILCDVHAPIDRLTAYERSRYQCASTERIQVL